VIGAAHSREGSRLGQRRLCHCRGESGKGRKAFLPAMGPRRRAGGGERSLEGTVEVDVGYCSDARWCSRRAPPRFMDYDIQEILTPTAEASFDPRKLDAFWDEADEEVPPRLQKGPAPSSRSHLALFITLEPRVE